ncbi:hypothetical protein CIP106467_1213 [Citrobacter europaeus]|uniref:hypothetical protein n=1 Tax=Citrobacter europaeus TaxID=1914243 RepID=UPI00088ACEBA|nr:hypothetical protein [Citrobacter europaeus]UBI16548.1 hypothetical protein LA337_02300 [Citrobacter europaeus]CAD7561013.1 hypothetical protein CIP106467_1213 [Citrobacter europaeus]
MQVHEGTQAAPVLVRRGVENSGFCMQSHAAKACMAIFIKKTGIFGSFYTDFLRGCAACLRMKI